MVKSIYETVRSFNKNNQGIQHLTLGHPSITQDPLTMDGCSEAIALDIFHAKQSIMDNEQKASLYYLLSEEQFDTAFHVLKNFLHDYSPITLYAELDILFKRLLDNPRALNLISTLIDEIKTSEELLWLKFMLLISQNIPIYRHEKTKSLFLEFAVSDALAYYMHKIVENWPDRIFWHKELMLNHQGWGLITGLEYLDLSEESNWCFIFDNIYPKLQNREFLLAYLYEKLDIFELLNMPHVLLRYSDELNSLFVAFLRQESKTLYKDSQRFLYHVLFLKRTLQEFEKFQLSPNQVEIYLHMIDLIQFHKEINPKQTSTYVPVLNELLLKFAQPEYIKNYFKTHESEHQSLIRLSRIGFVEERIKIKNEVLEDAYFYLPYYAINILPYAESLEIYQFFLEKLNLNRIAEGPHVKRDRVDLTPDEQILLELVMGLRYHRNKFPEFIITALQSSHENLRSSALITLFIWLRNSNTQLKDIHPQLSQLIYKLIEHMVADEQKLLMKQIVMKWNTYNEDFTSR